jgi:hypothetical protein
MLSNILRVGSACIAFLLLAACGSSEPPPPPVEETVFRDVAVTPVQKAREVEDMVLEQKEAMDRAIEQAESAQ